ncbi:MAG: RsmB/NOP family class I SAM-dependent RNA methyltransferase [Alphaproteobacteria bacterium]
MELNALTAAPQPAASSLPPEAAARRAALAVLDDVLGRNAPLDESLATRLGARLEARDRAFARHLAATTLRRLGQIDALIAAFVARPLPKEAHTARNILRLGAVQLVFLDTPPHAAVNETVALAGARGAERYRGLVNAVLRRLAAEGKQRAAAQDAAKLDTPEWLWNSWRAAYGEGTARRIADAHLAEPPLDFSVNGDPGPWAARLDAALLPTGSLRRSTGGLVTDFPGYAEGAWWIQDAAAALPVRLLGDVRGRHAIDLCAAPGGKTAQLAASGARVTAVEQSQPRLARLGENLARLRLAADLVAADAERWRPAAPADAVLLDAPCSATGTIRRHPDLPWRKTAKDIPALAAAQLRLLAAAAAMVKPGGRLIYAVCSLQPEEGPGVVARYLGENAAVVPEPVAAAEIPGAAEFLAADGTLRTLPCHWNERGGLDGFYVARFRRR